MAFSSEGDLDISHVAFGMEFTITKTTEFIQAIRVGQSLLPLRKGWVNKAGWGCQITFHCFSFPPGWVERKMLYPMWS